jgi:hypothetical protein
MEPIVYPETSVTNYQCTLSNIAEKRLSFLHSGGSVYLHIFCSNFYMLHCSKAAGVEGFQIVKLWRYVGRIVSQSALLSNPERGHTTRHPCLLAKRRNKVRTLMAQTASDLWMSMGGNRSILHKKMSD